MNYTLIIFAVITGILLLTSMILSAKAATEANNNNKEESHKYSTISAVLNGISLGVLIIIVVVYIYSYRLDVLTGIAKTLHKGGDILEKISVKEQPQILEMSSLYDSLN
jgi:NADH:ubiquinone oxidoreductase subunit 5 (subunit L)/multisubunit Na+/H+ antiporter MnhA subunit